MEISLDGEARKRANLRSLQRIDKHTIDIIGVATHVVLYEFLLDHNQWDKCNVEGSLFLTKRNETPRFQLVVLNRNSTENLEVPIHPGFQMQLNEPYLIFKNEGEGGGSGDSGQRIRGLWFHDAEERKTIFGLLQRVVKNAIHVTELEKKADTNLNANPNVTLSYAQKVAMKTGGSGEQVSGVNKARQVQGNSHSQVTKRQMQAQDAAAALMGALSITPSNTQLHAAHAPLTASTSKTQSHISPSLPSNVASSNPTTAATVSSTATASTPSSVGNPTHPSTSSHNQKTIVFDKKSLQLSLLSLIQDERFLDLIHAQYLKVAHARANRDANHTQAQTQVQGHPPYPYPNGPK